VIRKLPNAPQDVWRAGDDIPDPVENSDGTMTFYHGTIAARVDAIRRDGLRPNLAGYGDDAYVYLASTEGVALWWASRRAWSPAGSGSPIVLTIRIPKGWVRQTNGQWVTDHVVPASMIEFSGVAQAPIAREAEIPSTWYHLTDRARFKLDPNFAPADNAIAIVDRSGRPGIYLGEDVEVWVNGHGYWRPFVVVFQVDPSVVNDPGVHGRYGREMFVPASSFDKLTIERVIPLDAYAREVYGESGWIESNLGVEFDTGKPIQERYKGYHYPGPDVRVMSQAEVARLKKQLRQVKGPHAQARAPEHEESLDDEITRLDKAHADRIAQVFAAWAQSSAMVVTELGGGEELALLSPEMSMPQEGPMRLTYLMHDGPRGHDVGTRTQLAERLAQTLFLQVRPASEAEVMAWTTTPTYVRGAEIVALVQAENEFRQLASRMDRYQEVEAVLQQAHVLSHTDVEAATTLLQQTMARWQEGSGVASTPSRAQAGTHTYRPLIEQPFDVGEVVYHGTASSEDFTVLDGPAWITDDMAVASMYLEDGEGDRRILTYRIKKSPKLAVTDGHGDSWREFVAWANDGGAGDPERGVCDKGLDGYVVDRRSNTMICRPEEFLEFVRVTRMRPHAQAPIARARGVARAGRRDIPPEIQAVMPDLVRVAQREYDDWQQDAEGYDEEVGSGGICHLIADKMAGVLSDKNVMCTTVSSSHEVHVYVVVQLPSGVWNVDIRPHVYERGGGYTWKKIPDVSFEEADIDVDRLSPFPEDFGEYVDAEAPQRRVARAPESGLFAPFSQPEDQHALTLFLHHLAQWMGHAKTSDLEIVFEQWRKSVVLRQWLRDRVNPESMTLYHGTRWETREPLPVVGTIVHRPWPIVQWTDRLGLARWFAGIDKSGGPLAGPPGGTTWPKWIGGVVEEAHASDGQIVVATDALVDLLAAHKLELEAIGASQDTLGMFGGEKWEGEVLTTSAVDGRVIEAQVFA
jgi:hypothetical protein